MLLLFFTAGILRAQDGQPHTITALETSRRALLARTLAEGKIPFEERPLLAEYGGFGSSLHVPFFSGPREDGQKRSGVFILAVPLSGKDDDGRDFPFGFEIALSFIEKAREEGTQRDILVAFLADEWTALPPPEENPHRGLEDLYSRMEVPERTGLVYLDMNKAGEGIVVHHGARKALAPLNLLEPLGNCCDSRGIPYTLAIGYNELFKLSLAAGPSALEFAHEREIPALFLTAAGGPVKKSGETADTSATALGAMLLEYANSLDMGVENPDYHYLVFSIFGKNFFVSEYVTAIFFLAVAAFSLFSFLIYFVLFRHRLILQWKVFIQHSWLLLLFYGSLVLSLKGASLGFGFIAGTTVGERIFSEQYPRFFYGAAGIQLILGLALFMLIIPALDRITASWKANFYGSASVIMVALEILLAALLDITFIPIFIWLFLFTFLAACIRQPHLVRLCGLIAAIQGISVIGTLIRTGNTQLGTLILSGNMRSIFYMTLIALPFFTIFMRGTALLRKKRADQFRTAGMIPRLIFLGCSVIAAGTSAFFLSRFRVTEPALQTIAEAPGTPPLFKADIQDRILLERRTMGLTLEAPGNPLQFNLYLDNRTEQDKPGEESATELPVIYAAPMPFRYLGNENDPNRNTIAFTLGEGPPNPFTTEIVLPVDLRGYLRVEAVYFTRDGGIAPIAAPGKEYLLKISRRVPFGSP